MKEITTTTVTTEVIRRAPRKKTIARADHNVENGQILITETYAPALSKSHGEGLGISRICLSEARKKAKQGLSNVMVESSSPGQFCLATSLLHLTTIRDGISEMATRSGMGLIDKDNRERLMIIAVQLNEFIPILRDIMVNQVNLFANKQFTII
ncbi:hypothetical protein [uncultured Duncaniella sp.]|uniref:hypothetical protein n=1 Tax=uncultured Duncaniella sp. TaxID=2768039 RepID=UPI0026746E5E|nr:hypothetical protein [uncultured Duncaniella sp.]